jgi:ABC-2 type transport system permease protein
VLLAGMIGYGAANTAFSGLAITLVARRETGILKRIRATPLPPAVYLTAVLASIMIVFAIQVASLFALGRVLKSTPWPSHLLSLVLAVALGAATFAALGLAITGFIRSLEGSSAVLNVIVLPLAFLSGSFGQTQHYPKALRAIGDVLPLKYLLDLIKGIYLHGQEIWDKPTAVAVLAGWGLFGMVVALRTFRWEPREG